LSAFALAGYLLFFVVKRLFSLSLSFAEICTGVFWLASSREKDGVNENQSG
tara:strand:+ start:354 stop:506 length:153 start_codon:yes stop_codon:yes gene_type:complete